jgi:hypothetical protein
VSGDKPPPRRPLLGAPFWAALALSLVLILAGAVMGFLGPRLFPQRTPAPHPPTSQGLGAPLGNPAPPR